MRIFTAILLCIGFLITNGQYRFDHLAVSDGLSQNSINDILQDSDGFMWFATQDGLNRFDGYEFTRYMTDGELTVSDNFLWNLKEDSEGNIWSASRNGATRLNWKNGKSTHFLRSNKQNVTNSENQVDCIISLGDEMMISFSSRETYRIHSLLLMDSSEVVLTPSFQVSISPKEEEVLENGREINGALYMFFTNGLLIDNRWIPYPEDYSLARFHSSTLEDENGFYLGTANGLLYFNLESQIFTEIPAISELIFDLIWQKETRKIWVATNKGIMILDPESHQLETTIDLTNSNLTSESISSLYQSNDGLIWVGTANGGLNIYDPQKDRFKFLAMKDQPVWSSSLSDSVIWIGANDNLYQSKLGGKLTNEIFAEKSLRTELHPILSEGSRITCIKKLDNQTMLMGTAGSGIILIDSRIREIKKHIVFENGNTNFITSITKTPSHLIITTQNGILKLDYSFSLLEKYSDQLTDGFPTNYFMSSYMDSKGNVWIGSNTGITILYSDSIQHIVYNGHDQTRSPAFNFVTGFHEDYLGRMWMSTFGGGVSCLDVKTKHFFHLKKVDGLANNVCASIEGNGHQVYVGTNEGLSKIDVETLQITNYTTSDGLLANEFAIGSASKKNDEYLFGTVDGLVVFNENSLENEIKFQKPSITNLSINYEVVDLSKMEGSVLHLNPKDQIFSLEFSDLSFRNRDKICYEYKMTGFNEHWIKSNTANRRAIYSLSPGSYTFEVRTLNGAIKSESTQLSVIVHPAFYQTWWFITLSILILIFMVVSIARYFSHQSLKEKLRKLEVQQKIQSERERISRDLHDNVGSQITYIASSIDHLSSNGKADEIRELGEFTRDTMRQLRETIWVINHDEVSLGELKAKVIDYLAETLKYKPEITHRVSFSNNDISLNPTWAINVFRIIQEAVNNAVKHANPTSIEVEFIYEKEAYITIKDDGVGFNGEDKMGHFGLVNMRSRVADIGGKFKIKSEEGKGTEICISELKIGQMT